MKWIILLSVVLFAASCSNESATVPTAKASVKVEIKAAELASGLKAGFKRGEAPVYVAGVVLTADNIEYDVANVVTSFDFASNVATEGDDIVLEGLTVGTNSITATGTAKYTANNAHYVIPAEKQGVDLNAKSTAYANYLSGEHGVYAAYVSKNAVTKDISNVGDNAIAVEMVTNNHRVAVVLENPADSEYDLKWRVLEGETEMFTSGANFMDAGSQEAYVINSTSATGSKTYTVKVDYYTKDTHVLMEGMTITKNIAAESYDNITKLYRFVKGDLLTGQALTTFTWRPLEEKNSGEDIQ